MAREPLSAAALLLLATLALPGCTSDGPPVPPLGLSGVQSAGQTSLAAAEETGDGGQGPGPMASAAPSVMGSQAPAYPVGPKAAGLAPPTRMTDANGAVSGNLYGGPAAALPDGAVGAAPTAAAFPASGTRQPIAEAAGAAKTQAPAQAAPAPVLASPAPDAAPKDMQARAAAASGSAGSIRFMPVIGAPVSAVTPLSKELGIAARNRGLAIKTAGNATTDNILKGYFSAVSDAGSTTVVYVWDVLDNSGNRIHRIQGQTVVKGEAADPWTAVPAAAMADIADRTVSEYLAWRSGRTG